MNASGYQTIRRLRRDSKCERRLAPSQAPCFSTEPFRGAPGAEKRLWPRCLRHADSSPTLGAEQARISEAADWEVTVDGFRNDERNSQQRDASH